MKLDHRNAVVFFPALLLILVIALGCQMVTSAPTPIPTIPPTETLEPATSTPPEPTWTPSLTPTKTPIPTSTVNPAASSFGDLILNAIRDREPFFQDDFSFNNGWKVEADFPGSLTLSLNGGYIQTTNDGGRDYIHIQYPIFSDLRNYVLMVDAAFIESPSMPRDRAIGLCWFPGDNWGERFLLFESGDYLGGTCRPDEECPNFVNGRVDPVPVEQFVSLILIHRKGESAVYVNGRPVAYHRLAITEPSANFSLCPHAFDGKPTNIKYDNVRVWNLYRVPGLP